MADMLECSSLPSVLGRLLNTPVKCLQVIARVKLLKMMAVIFNRVVLLSRVSVRISTVIFKSTVVFGWYACLIHCKKIPMYS